MAVFEEKQKQYQEENRKINVSVDTKAIWIAIASFEMKQLLGAKLKLRKKSVGSFAAVVLHGVSQENKGSAFHFGHSA